MANDRLKLAISRLDRAAARIERVISEGGALPSRSQQDEQLARRHEALRQQVRSAIARIDSVIAAAER